MKFTVRTIKEKLIKIMKNVCVIPVDSQTIIYDFVTIQNEKNRKSNVIDKIPQFDEISVTDYAS